MKNGSPIPTAAPKRFYKSAGIAETADGWQVQLDGRGVRTPKRAPLIPPTKALAEAIAAEWEAQAETIDPRTMPLTKLANSMLDGVIPRLGEVQAEITAYAGNDLLCYRAEHPDRLAQMQHERWDPLLTWATERFGARLHTTIGVMPVSQGEDCIAKLRSAVEALDAYALAAAHVMTALMGSAVLALAHIHGRLTTEEAWEAAHLDEDFQIAQWGEDAEARARREGRYAELRAAATFYRLSRS